jgi:hypothetical protein
VALGFYIYMVRVGFEHHKIMPGAGGGGVAKEWAKAFYNSMAWQQVRREVLRRDRYTCCRCASRAEEVHHIIELMPENISDPSIALNPKNLESLCHDCHTKETKGCDGDVVQGYYFDENGLVVRQQPPGGQK